ncbi:MAG: DUF3363 domain-containing protein [Acidovorax sp.]
MVWRVPKDGRRCTPRCSSSTCGRYGPHRRPRRRSRRYHQPIQPANDRFAMLDDGMGFSLVPWTPVMERCLGQQLSVTMQGSTVSWQIGRQRGPGI